MAIKNSNSHKHRKLSRYTGDVSKRRRRNSIGLWWLIPASALAAFLLALLLGNCLGSRVDEPGESSAPETQNNGSAFPPPVSSKTESIDAIFAGLEGIYDNTYYEVSKQIPEGTMAISLSMFYSNGTPIYNSPVAEENGKASGELTLKNIFRYTNENDIYVSVPFSSSGLSKDDSAAAIYETELIKELYESGADEVIIKCDRKAPTDLLLLRLAEYFTEVKKAVPEIHLGFMITSDEAKDTETVERICDYADFCAVDTSAVADLDKAMGESLVNVLRYNMRVLIKGGTEENYAILDKYGIKNRQVIAK